MSPYYLNLASVSDRVMGEGLTVGREVVGLVVSVVEVVAGGGGGS